MLMNSCAAAHGSSVLHCVEDAPAESDASESHRLELHNTENAASTPVLETPHSSISFSITQSDCNWTPMFIRQPDGSLTLMAPMDYFEPAPHTPATETQTATSQLRETARALRNAVEREIAADKLRRASVRQAFCVKS
jgi:hypothetical protein